MPDVPGRRVPLRGRDRRVLPRLGALQQPEEVPGRVRREELLRLPAGELSLWDEPVHLRDVALRRPGGLLGRQRREGLLGRRAQEGDHGRPDRQPGLQSPVGHRARLRPQTPLAQEQRVQVRTLAAIRQSPALLGLNSSFFFLLQSV